jgi:undecaprenyl-diphosphatase
MEYVILGIIQGIFEWLPISSQGITAVAASILIKEVNPIDVALFLHIGTFFAVLIYFRKEWVRVFTLKDVVFFRFLLISTILSGVIGFFLYSLIENITVGSSLLFITGIGLFFTAFFHKFKKNKTIEGDKLAIISGLLQGLSVIPGLSRSGSTIFGLSLGITDTKEILKVSYMMSAPVTIGMAFFMFMKEPVLVQESWPALLSSFFVGILFLDILLKSVDKIDFFKFAIIFGVLCFVGAGIGIL